MLNTDTHKDREDHSERPHSGSGPQSRDMPGQYGVLNENLLQALVDGELGDEDRKRIMGEALKSPAALKRLSELYLLKSRLIQWWSHNGKDN